MKLMRCPINGLRPIQEFAYGGARAPAPRSSAPQTDAQWADYVFYRPGEPGVKREWWYHLASGTWFIAERDTHTDEIVHTYLFADERR